MAANGGDVGRCYGFSGVPDLTKSTAGSAHIPSIAVKPHSFNSTDPDAGILGVSDLPPGKNPFSCVVVSGLSRRATGEWAVRAAAGDSVATGGLSSCSAALLSLVRLLRDARWLSSF